MNSFPTPGASITSESGACDCPFWLFPSTLPPQALKQNVMNAFQFHCCAHHGTELDNAKTSEITSQIISLSINGDRHQLWYSIITRNNGFFPTRHLPSIQCWRPVCDSPSRLCRLKQEQRKSAQQVDKGNDHVLFLEVFFFSPQQVCQGKEWSNGLAFESLSFPSTVIRGLQCLQVIWEQPSKE